MGFRSLVSIHCFPLPAALSLTRVIGEVEGKEGRRSVSMVHGGRQWCVCNSVSLDHSRSLHSFTEKGSTKMVALEASNLD